MKRRAFVAGLPLLAASVPAVVRAAPNTGRPARPGSPLTIGQPPPPLNASRISGTDQVTLTGLAGRVALIDFWATWCSACRSIMPELDQLYSRHQPGGFSLVGVSPEPEGAIRGMLAQHPVGYTIARDTGGTLPAYGVRGIPMLVLLGRDGKVRHVQVGADPSSMTALDAMVTGLLRESA